MSTFRNVEYCEMDAAFFEDAIKNGLPDHYEVNFDLPENNMFFKVNAQFGEIPLIGLDCDGPNQKPWTLCDMGILNEPRLLYLRMEVSPVEFHTNLREIEVGSFEEATNQLMVTALKGSNIDDFNLYDTDTGFQAIEFYGDSLQKLEPNFEKEVPDPYGF